MARSSVPVIGTHGSPFLGKGKWQANFGFRYAQSDRHFVGIQEQVNRETEQSEVRNFLYLADFTATYGLTNRTNISLSIPFLFADRSQPIRVSGKVVSRYTTHTREIADSAVMVRRWMFDTEKHTTQNLSLGIGVKVPMGNNDVRDTFRTSLTTTAERTVDQSIQPGDGKVGMVVDMQAFKQIWKATFSAGASYLLNPAETNGQPTYRTRQSESIFSVPDLYLVRVGVAVPVLPKQGLSVSLAGRWEGVPVTDLFGGSKGFRRPGYAVSIEPGLIFGWRSHVFSLLTPVALMRNRQQSVPDKADGVWGDAAFADSFWIFGYSKRF